MQAYSAERSSRLGHHSICFALHIRCPGTKVAISAEQARRTVEAFGYYNDMYTAVGPDASDEVFPMEAQLLIDLPPPRKLVWRLGKRRKCAAYPSFHLTDMLLWWQEKNNANELLNGRQPSMAELSMWPRESLR